MIAGHIWRLKHEVSKWWGHSSTRRESDLSHTSAKIRSNSRLKSQLDFLIWMRPVNEKVWF